VKLEPKWKVEYQKEIEHAIQARSNGNEGMARVCARRAAGVVIGEYLNRCGYSNLTHSAYARLSIFMSLPNANQKSKEIASHLLLKVNKDHLLPMEADLISEVMWLNKSLFSESNE
jgi:hypothetical protein